MPDKNKASIATPKEFSFEECLMYLNRSADENLHFIENGSLYKLLRIEDELILLKISNHGNSLGVEFLNFCPRKPVYEAALNYVNDWFDLATDLTPFYKLSGNDNLLKNLVTKYYGLRLIGIPNLFKAISWAIIGQQINLEFAYTLKKRFVESFGEKISFDGKVYRLFPVPEEILNLSVKNLMDLQFTGRKAEYIIELAYKIQNDIIPKRAELINADFETATEELLKIRGVGHWTANYVLMRCLRKYAAFPVDDIGLQNALQEQLSLSYKPTIDDIKKVSNNWGDWKAYATFYLWRSLL